MVGQYLTELCLMNRINYNMKMKSETVINKLKQLFFIAIGIQVALFIAVAFRVIDIYLESAVISVVVERYALLVTLISIPGALKLFSMIMEKNEHPNDEVATTSLYIKAFIARFGILFLVASINIVLYALSLNQNYMLCTLITFTAYIFTYPSANYLRVAEEKKEQSEEQQHEQDK